MTRIDELRQEIEQEMTTTRRLLERVPGDRPDWKPHPKSFSVAHLAQLVSWIPGWIANTLSQDRLDLLSAPGYSNESTETLVRGFDANVAAVRSALANAKDEDLALPWELARGDQVFIKSTRGVMVRSHISHLSHHRGQLTVYLRMLDVPLPMIYGPTADERTPLS